MTIYQLLMERLRMQLQLVFNNYVGIMALSVFALFCAHTAFGQCQVSVNENAFICEDPLGFHDSVSLGQGMILVGTPPFKFSWYIREVRTYWGITTIYWGSDILSDTTSQFPQVVNHAVDEFTAILTVTDSSGCSSQDTTIVATSKVFGTLAGPTHFGIDQGDSVQVFAANTLVGGIPPTSYSWSSPSTLQFPNSVHPGWAWPDTTTKYYLTLSDSAGCSHSIHAITVYVVLSDEEVTKDKVLVYPNPTSGRINFSGMTNTCSVKLLDPTGKLILSRELEGNSLNMDGLSAGLYFLELTDSHGGSILRQKVLLYH